MSGIIQAIAGVLGASAATTPWAYPLAASWTDRGAMFPSPQPWDYNNSPGSQGFVEVGGTGYFYFEGGQSPGHADWSDFAAFGLATSQDGITWTEHASNPLATFLPLGVGSGDILTAEGYFYHAVTILPTGQFICAFGGATATDPGDVKIDMFRQTSNDGISWSPNNAAGKALIAAWNQSGWVHNAGNSGYNEICPVGLWYDVANSTLHMIYIQKTVAAEWSLDHVSGTDIANLLGANSAAFLALASNPVEANGQYRGGAIVDRGGGVVDVLVIATNAAFDTHALCRVPVLPDYSWTAPGPIEILYYMQSDFSQTGWREGSVAFYAAASLAFMPYNVGGFCHSRTAPAVRTTDGRLAYSPVSARFTSASTQYFEKTTALTGVASSQLVSFSCWFRAATLHNGTVIRMTTAGAADRFIIYLLSDGRVDIVARNSSNVVILDIANAIGTAFSANTDYWLGVSIDMTSYANCRIYLNNTDIKQASVGTQTFTTNGTIDFGGCTVCRVGVDSGTSFPLNAALADYGLLIGQRLDYGSTPIRRRFVTASNELQNPEVDGRRLFGKKPIIFFTGNGTGFPVNKGSGGSFNAVTNGPLTNGSTPAGHP